jgi:hypothetical protein
MFEHNIRRLEYLNIATAFELLQVLERSELAAADDGHLPDAIRYQAVGLLHDSRYVCAHCAQQQRSGARI